MAIYQILEGWTALVLVLALFALLFLQAAAFRRSGHRAFLLFSIGSALCIVYAVFSTVPFFVQITDPQRLFLFVCSCASAVVAAILGVVGTAGLLRSYGRPLQATQSARNSA